MQRPIWTKLRRKRSHGLRSRLSYLTTSSKVQLLARQLDVQPVQLRLRGLGQVLPLVVGLERLAVQGGALYGGER